MAYDGKQYANLSAGAWRAEWDDGTGFPDWTPEQHAHLGAFLGKHGAEYHSLEQWDQMWAKFKDGIDQFDGFDVADLQAHAIQRRAGHEHVSTTLGYVKQAEDIKGTVGVPFGPIPLALLGQGMGQVRLNVKKSRRKLVEPPGIEPGSASAR